MYDNSLKVPTIVKWPGVIRGETVIEDTITSLDWYPTLVDIAGSQLPAEHLVRGHSIAPLLKDKTPDDWNQDYYGEYSIINYCRADM
jgi:arylsulfatase A-like enzyme